MGVNSTSSLTFRLLGKDESASKTFGQAAGNAEKAHGKFERLGNAVGGMAKMAGRLGAVFGAAGIAGGVLGVKTAASMEQAHIAFETMLGSASKADVFLKGLADFAAKTPFEFPELQTAASSLISAGIEAGKVIPIMTTLGDVTSGMGTGSEGVQRATIALQQMSAAGRITGEDLNQLRDAGIPVFDLLAAATGKSKAEVVKLAQAGKLGSKELGQLMTALETGKGLERFSGLMDKQSKSLTGLWSTFKDTLGMGLAKLLAPAVPALKAGLGQLTGVIEGAFKGLSVFFGALSGQSEVNEFSGALRKVNNIGIAVGTVIRNLVRGVTVFVAALTGRSEVNEFDGALRKVNNAGIGVATVIGHVAEVVRKLWPAVKDVALTLGGALVGAFTALYHLLEPTVLNALSAIAGFLGKHTTLVTSLASAVVAIVAAWKTYQAIAKAVAVVQAALNFVMAMNPIGILVLAIAGLVTAFVIAYQKSETFRNIVNGVFGAVAKAVGDAVSLMIRGFRGWLTVWLTVADGIVSGAAMALGWVPGIGDKLKSANKAFDKFKNDTLTTLDNMAEAAGGLGEKTAKKLKTGFAKVIGPNGLTTYVNVLPNGRIFEQTAHRASGGPMLPGRTYTVGENGPETMTMGALGATVAPYGSAEMAGSSSITLNITTLLDGEVVYRSVQKSALRQGRRSVSNGLATA